MVNDISSGGCLGDKEDGPLFKFYEVIRDSGDEFMRQASRFQNITLFAPRNAAWEAPEVKAILQDTRRVKDILKMHFVREYLPLDVIERKTNRQVATSLERTNLYFDVAVGPSGNHSVTVEGGGVNASIITANIGATNGIIHIIDRVFGVPYSTVLDKLRTDPTLNSTYHLGNRYEFNEQLGNPKKRYTYFAPQDKAWIALEVWAPSVQKKLFMDDFSYHTKQILERHLAVGEDLTMKKLVECSKNGSCALKTMRDKVKVIVKENQEQIYPSSQGNQETSRTDNFYDENAIIPNYGGYIIEWNNKKYKVIRPDVACTNGIIHVIDGVLVSESDVQVTGSGSRSFVTFVLPNVLTILITKWLL
ncbi:hypothetical protein QAD02_008842 [Eretmocerus hayati]|uniref:Uncharacterized protein n=1 Tax=Eretmocerus hayati TaxID=131215 RepID=A0ACC2N7L9_9HYME|nr:hypothetical protein QAD02_008842 [Eretmocerus hayati]